MTFRPTTLFRAAAAGGPALLAAGVDPDDLHAVAPPQTSRTEATPPHVDAGTDDLAAQPPNEDVAAGPTIKLDPLALDAGNSCVQCGLCLPACPTYLETANEADSPRGRIRIMLGLHDGSVDLTPAGQSHLDRCLDCRACETACPSGVAFHTLLEDARHKLEVRQEQTGGRLPTQTRFQRFLFRQLLTRPNRLRLSLVPARLLQRARLWSVLEGIGAFNLLPGTLRRMTRMLGDDPSAPLWPRPLPAHSRAGGMDMVVRMLNPAAAEASQRPKLLVGFFEGCVAQVLAARVHHQAAELLCAAGADVISPPSQICCGAIHHHNNDPESARSMARQNIDTYLPEGGGVELDRIVTCTAGDGAMLRQYGELLADDPQYAGRAKRFAAKVRDVSEVLVELDLPKIRRPLAGTVTYHDACHLAHGQRVTSAPRQLLAKIPGLTVVDLPESDVCCGAAGTYNLTQPEMASALADRKLDRVRETGTQIVVSGNVGCTMHLAAQAAWRGEKVTILHPVEILHEAYFGLGE